MMRKALFNRNFFIMLALDVVLLATSWLLAYGLRFELQVPVKFIDEMLALLPIVVSVQIACLYGFDVYRGMWRFTSVGDLLNILKALALSTLVIVLLAVLIYRFRNVPRSVVFINFCIGVLAVSGARLGIRLFYQKFVPAKPIQSLSNPQSISDTHRPATPPRRLLIIGAGSCGEKILREIRDNRLLNYEIVGFLDDNPGKIGKKIHGVIVRGIIADLPFVAKKNEVDEVLIAIPSADASEMRRIVDICKHSGIRFRTVPAYGELINGQVSIRAAREVAYRDLIGRKTVRLDEKMIADHLKGKKVLVTGAGGSIGSELCRQILRFGVEGLVLFERAESSLFEIDTELRSEAKQAVIPVLGDICDPRHLEEVFHRHSPHIVYHAAAYKHVPMLERHPWKAIENNILGTWNLIRACNACRVERFVLVSTDKAVRPASVMGASKRLAEMIALNQNSCGGVETRYLAVRFGNVIGSAGSVVPLFQKQIEKGGPVTVTHPEATRFFMTVREAAQLILQAAAMGEGGEIFILDMGTPVKIVEMARDLIRLSGFEPDRDIRIEFTGLRPGEKLYEELITADERLMPTAHPQIFQLNGTTCDLCLLNGHLADLVVLMHKKDPDAIRLKLQEVVPDYRSA